VPAGDAVVGTLRFAHPMALPATPSLSDTSKKSQSFFRGRRVYGERMDTGFELGGERLVDHAVASKSALAPECASHDIHPEMRFSSRPMSGVTFMLMGFVQYAQAQRRKRLGQFPRNGFLHTHRDSRAKTANGDFTISLIGIPASTP
jgi:hypothetical protein